MRELIDERIAFEHLAEIMGYVERTLSRQINDAELCEPDRLRGLTLRNVAGFIQQFLPTTSNAEEEAIRVVLDAAKSALAERKLTLPELDKAALDKPLVDSLYPRRWTDYHRSTTPVVSGTGLEKKE